jgi:hypothetical protein
LFAYNMSFLHTSVSLKFGYSIHLNPIHWSWFPSDIMANSWSPF